MENCLFCRIVERQAPAQVVYEDDSVVAFKDLHPQAPVHLLVVPRKHLESLTQAKAEDEPLIGHLFGVAARLARENKLEKGCRTLINSGPWAGQSVYHLHVHVLGGRAFHWPPG
jgi:histidine triad (HIT) family protein